MIEGIIKLKNDDQRIISYHRERLAKGINTLKCSNSIYEDIKKY